MGDKQWGPKECNESDLGRLVGVVYNAIRLTNVFEAICEGTDTFMRRTFCAYWI